MIARLVAAYVILAWGLLGGATAATGADAPAGTILVSKPAAGTVHHALVEGLKLIDAGDFEGWMAQWCSAKKLCYNKNSRKAVAKYNLPARKRTAASCLRGDRDAVLVTRVEGDPARDDAVKIYLQCSEDAMPRPFSLQKEPAGWRFTKI
jgi:hypothetical protein